MVTGHHILQLADFISANSIYYIYILLACIFICIYSNLKFVLETFLLELFILKQIHLKIFFYLFILDCAGFSVVAAHGLLIVAASLVVEHRL